MNDSKQILILLFHYRVYFSNKIGNSSFNDLKPAISFFEEDLVIENYKLK